MKVVVREQGSVVAAHATRLADEQFQSHFRIAADRVTLSGDVTIKRRIAADQLAQVGLNGFAVVHQNSIHDFLVRSTQAVPVGLVSVWRAGGGKALFVGQQRAEWKIRKRRV